MNGKYLKTFFGASWIIMLVLGIFFGYIISENIFSDARENFMAVPEDSFHVTVPIVAASDDTGMIGNATFNLVLGNGRILFSSNPAIDTDMQYSMIIASAYAQQYSNNILNDSDLVIDLDITMDVLGGVSAGAPITLGMIALLQGKKINNSIILTGTINPDGTIGRVGEIREKAMAAKGAGYSMMLVPAGQSRVRGQNYTLQQYFNDTIIIREVSNMDQAVQIMIE